MIYRILDANLNRMREGIRVIEDIARYALNSKLLSRELKNLRHKARVNIDILSHRDIVNDVSKESIDSETNRSTLLDVVVANFKRAQESARVIEEIVKLDPSIGDHRVFKDIRYQLYDIELRFIKECDNM